MNDNITAPPGAPGDAPEQKPNAELAALAREARALDNEPAASAAQEQNKVALSMSAQNEGELHAALTMARDAALPLLAAVLSEQKAVMLSAIWSDQTLAAIAKNGAQVLALHGVAVSGLTAGMGPYVGLALALGPAAFATYKVLTMPEPQPPQEVAS